MRDTNFKWWWLSYADESGFLGALIIPAPDFIGACQIASITKLSPGGEVLGFEIYNDEAKKKITLFDIMRLFTKEEAQRIADLI